MTDYDLAIIGGGINGCGIARDAAGRGLRVLLCEQNDLASATSSASTKLIHGGLRYLERGDFRLVRESLMEREHLLRIAPHLIRPLRFILPRTPDMRADWLLRLGLFLYDRLGGARNAALPATRTLNLRTDPVGEPLAINAKAGYAYFDCQVDDARLAVLNAVDAAARGAEIKTNAPCIDYHRAHDKQSKSNVWFFNVDGKQCSARALINVAGANADQVHTAATGEDAKLRLVRGSHIVVPSLFAGDHAYLLQNTDRRVVFAIPFAASLGHYTLVGTTDCAHASDDAPQISNTEINYLLDVIARYFKKPCTRDDIVWHFSGVRALLEDGTENPSAVTREYRLKLHGAPPLLSVFGGKLTTYRKLAEKAVDALATFFPNLPCGWTANAALPGGDLPVGGVAKTASQLCAQCEDLDDAHAMRLASAYGTRAREVLDGAHCISDLGVHFGGGLYAREVAYLIEHEWARSVEDILWRRSKLGLVLNVAQQKNLREWLSERV